MKKLQINLGNEKSGKVSQFTINVIDQPDSFSAKYVRKALQSLVMKLVHNQSFSLGVSKGEKITVHVEFESLSVPFKPIYFGGGRGADQLKEQLSIFVADLKELVK